MCDGSAADVFENAVALAIIKDAARR